MMLSMLDRKDPVRGRAARDRWSMPMRKPTIPASAQRPMKLYPANHGRVQAKGGANSAGLTFRGAWASGAGSVLWSMLNRRSLMFTVADH